MRIGIDIDDTIANTDEILMAYALEYDKKYLRDKGLINPHKYYLEEKFDWSLEEKQTFLDCYCMDIYNNVTIKDNAISVINELKSMGHDIYIITLRGIKGNIDAYETTSKWLKNNNINYDKLIVKAIDKGAICNLHDIDFFVDDSIKHCTSVLAYDIEVLLFDSQYNRENKNIRRVSNWLEIKDIILGGNCNG